MKTLPDRPYTKKDYGPELSPMDELMRKIAIGVAFISVFVFFVKLLFL